MLDLIERDRKVLWHPYTQQGLGAQPLPVLSGEGAYLYLCDSWKTQELPQKIPKKIPKKIFDAISSWWVNIHGHSHPEIVRAIADQAARMEHVLFAGFTHEPAVELAELLVQAAAERKTRITRAFFSDNGSTAVEVALKMAYQFHHNRGDSRRTRFLALRHSYHGDTLGAMAVGEPDGFHVPFRKLLPTVDFAVPGDLDGLSALLEAHRGEYAAFIFEPLIQGAGGMKIHSPEYLRAAVQLCQEQGILGIADEVFTGFYRTGKCFAFEHAGISPDLICLSKGITGGFLPLAVTLATEEVFSAFLSQDIRKAFLHGHSYTANPIACAAAIASWKLLQEESCQDRIRLISRKTAESIARLREHPGVISARSLGTIGAVEMDSDSTYFSSSPARSMELALARGVLLRPLGSVFYAVPPYCSEEQEINTVYYVIEEIIHEYTRKSI